MVFGFLGLSVIYLTISFYSRSVRREKLENAWDENPPKGGDTDARDTYIETGMAEYETGFRKKLIWLVYVIPTISILVILYLTNSQ
jgi:hypothetical protein